MHPIELQSRREAIGVDILTLAEQLHCAPATLARYETGAQPIPDTVETTLVSLEFAFGVVVGLHEEFLVPPDLHTYTSDAGFWRDWPIMTGVPSVIHRAATAAVLAIAKHNGIHARIVPATGQGPVCVQCSTCNGIALALRSDEPGTFIDVYDQTWRQDHTGTYCPLHQPRHVPTSIDV